MSNITLMTAILTLLISISLKFFTAVFTYENIYSFSLNKILMAIPPSHSALVGAKLFFLVPRRMHQQSPTLLTINVGWGLGLTRNHFNCLSGTLRSPLQTGLDCVYADSCCLSDLGITKSLTVKFKNSLPLRICHRENLLNYFSIDSNALFADQVKFFFGESK